MHIRVGAAPAAVSRIRAVAGPCNAVTMPGRLGVPGTTPLGALVLVRLDVRPVEPTGR